MIRCFVGGVLLASGVAAFAQTQPATQPVPSGTPITLHLEDETSQSAFAKFAAQTHLQIQGNVPDFWRREKEDHRVTYSFDAAPYWEVFTKLAADASVIPYGWSNGHMDLGHDEGAWSGRPAQIFGPLRVSVASVDVHRMILIAHRPQRVKSTTIGMIIEAEPGFAAVYLADVAIPVIEDQKGRPIEVDLPKPQFMNFISGHAWIQVTLKALADDVSAVNKLQAKFITVIARTQTLEIPDITAANELHREIGGIKTTISCKKTANGYTIDVRAEPGTPDDSWPALARALTFSEMSLVDAHGVAYASMSSSAGTQPVHVTRSVNFVQQRRMGGDVPAAPQKLIWVVPVSVGSVPIAVEFNDLPLP